MQKANQNTKRKHAVGAEREKKASMRKTIDLVPLSNWLRLWRHFSKDNWDTSQLGYQYIAKVLEIFSSNLAKIYPYFKYTRLRMIVILTRHRTLVSMCDSIPYLTSQTALQCKDRLITLLQSSLWREIKDRVKYPLPRSWDIC